MCRVACPACCSLFQMYGLCPWMIPCVKEWMHQIIINLNNSPRRGHFDLIKCFLYLWHGGASWLMSFRRFLWPFLYRDRFDDRFVVCIQIVVHNLGTWKERICKILWNEIRCIHVSITCIILCVCVCVCHFNTSSLCTYISIYFHIKFFYLVCASVLPNFYNCHFGMACLGLSECGIIWNACRYFRISKIARTFNVERCYCYTVAQPFQVLLFWVI